MRNNIITAAAVAASAILLTLSCTKQEEMQSKDRSTTTKEGKAFTAVIEQDLTKTILDDDLNVYWEDGDEIAVNGALYVAQLDAPSEKASFTPVKEEATFRDHYSAFFPASLVTESGWELPAKQVYKKGSINSPMFAVSNTDKLVFHNLCGVLNLALTGTDKIKSITLTTAAGELLHGLFDVQIVESENGTSVGKAALLGVDNTPEFQTVTLDCGEDGVQLDAENATDFYIYLPPQEYAAGMKLTITREDGSTFEQVTGNDVTVERNAVYTFEWNVEMNLLQALAKFFKGLSEDQAALAAVTDEALKPMSEQQLKYVQDNPQKFFLPEIHTWKNARSAIMAIEKSIDKIKSDDNVQDVMGLTESELMFLRGYLYLELARTYGQAPVMSLENPNPQLTPFGTLKADIVKYATEAYSNLPYNWGEGRTTIELAEGIVMKRPTKIAAAMLLVHTWLYESSPLFSQTVNMANINKAITLCDEAMAFHPLYEYEQIWNGGLNSSELIFAVSFATNNAWEGIQPTQSLVDLYTLYQEENQFKEIYDTEPIEISSVEFDELETRFDVTVNVPNSVAGYSLKKDVAHILPIFRTGGALLDKAEAQILLGKFAEACTTVNILHSRAKSGQWLQLVPEKIGRFEEECLVELAFEGHRFWDVRRWKKGGEYFKQIDVAEFSVGENGLQFTRKPVTLPWSDDYNFYPVPQE